MTGERQSYPQSVANIEVPRRQPVSRAELQRYERPIKHFDLPPEVLGGLNIQEKRILERLEEAAQGVESLYLLQERGDKKGKFYPPRVRRLTVEREAKQNPDLLSPYTIVERGEDGMLLARPTIQVQRDLIKEKRIARFLRDTANEAGKGRKRDFQLQAYLNAKARSLEVGTFEAIKASERIWLEREDEPTVDIIIGLNDTYLDKFGRKYAWWASVGVLDGESTHQQWFTSAFRSWWQEETGQVPSKVNTRIDNTTIQVGLIARYEWVGQSLPCLLEWRHELGSKIVIFKPMFEDKFWHEMLPNFKDFVNKINIQGINDWFVRNATLRFYIAHEVGHSLVRGRDMEQRLSGHKDWIKELYCDLLALTGYRNLKGIDSRRESEMAMAMALAKGYLEYEDRRRREEYHKAATVMLNYLLEKGSVWIEHGLFTWHDTQEVFDDIDDFRHIVQTILEEGKAKDAQNLLDRYFKPDAYRYLIARWSFPIATEDTQHTAPHLPI